MGYSGLLTIAIFFSSFYKILAEDSYMQLDDLDPFFYSGAPGTQMGVDELKTNSDIPHLPVFYGYMGTHGTYRFLSITEQVLTVIGEGKHGLWRIQESGYIREYRASGMQGLPEGSDITAPDNLESISSNYASYLPEESWGGYKYPDQNIDSTYGLNWVDLPINHPKYNGKYDDHVPIDLSHWYCTMSGPEFLQAKRAWEFAMKQPASNQIGPLGRRAGLDIEELYTNVARFELFPDAQIWINIGQGMDSDYFTQESLENHQKVTVDYRALDLSKMNAELYIYERPFFNVPYLFVTVVIDGPGLSYIRPHGLYYQHLMERDGSVSASAETILYPSYFVESESDSKEAIGLPLYGVNHHNRKKHGFTGGVCPQRGGDWGYYPFENSGSAWPTNLEEIAPLCDGIVMDIKLWTNLNGVSWSDSSYMLGNTAMDSLQVEYTVENNIYGIYIDPYLVETGAVNPYILDFTDDANIVHSGEDMTTTIITVEFAELASPPCYVNTTTASICFSKAFTYLIGNSLTLRCRRTGCK